MKREAVRVGLRSWAHRLGLGLLVTLLAESTSCLLITNRDKNQCASTKDCQSLGAAFAATQCVDGLCEQGTGFCRDTTDCLANPSTPNTYCDPNRHCQSVLSEDCQSILTDKDQPIAKNALVLGVLAPLSGENQLDGEARVKAIRLGLREFTQYAVGIPSPGNPPRPLALVVCDQVSNPVRAAQHLVNELHVPAIIGPGFSGTTVKVANDVTINGKTLMISPSTSTPDLTNLVDYGLVWRTASSYAPEPLAIAQLVTQMTQDPTLRTTFALDSKPLKVAVIAKGDSYGKGLAERLQVTLRFNGKDAAENGSNFQRFDFPEPAPASVPSFIGEIVDRWRPHIVFALGTAEVVTQGMVPIEENWFTGDGGQPRPYYIFTEGARLSSLITAVGESTVRHPDRNLKGRIRAFGPRYNAQLEGSLKLRYKADTGEEMSGAYGVAGSYDAFYLLAYAMVATQAEPLSGPVLAEGLKRMVPPGQLIEAGPTGISLAINELSQGKNIDYDGVVGALNFDVTTGEAPGNYNIYCVNSSEFVVQSQYFDSAESVLVGDYAPCP